MLPNPRAAVPASTVFWACVLAGTAAFTLDLSSPLGVAAGIPYAVVVLTSSFARRRDLILGTALVASVLIMVGYALSSPGAEAWVVLLNRGMALAVLWTMAALLIARIGAEAACHQLEGKFQTIVRGAPDGIVIINTEGEIVLVNTRATKLFGYREEDLLGRPIEILVPPRSRAAHCPHRTHFIENPQHRSMRDTGDLVGWRKDGTEFPVEISLDAVTTPEGLMVISTIRDLTARRHLEAQLLQAQKMDALGTLAGGVAHDFNNLLQVILGYADAARWELSSGSVSEARHCLDEVLKASGRAKELVHQILAFSRRSDTTQEPVDVVEMVGETMVLVQASLSPSIELRTHAEVEACSVTGDRGQLHQVVLNLATNAADAIGEDGGVLEVSVDIVVLGAEQTSRLNASAPGSFVRVQVRDNGQGMDEATMARMYEPFFTTKERGRGTGLGLAVVHGTVYGHGGGIDVQSEVGVGTTVSVYLPVVGDHVPA